MTEVLTCLDKIGRCPSCDQVQMNRYCHTYVGPCYGREPRVLFVGLDHGDDDFTEAAVDRQQGIVRWFRDEQHEWNPHYQGCVWVASKLFRINCVEDCRERCARKPEAECALLHFAQGNAVKCTGGATN